MLKLKGYMDRKNLAGRNNELKKLPSKAWKSIWSAGHGVASIHDVLPVKALAERLKTEFLEAVIEQGRLLGTFK